MAKVFIGVPVYNSERYIKQAIDSLRNQTYKNWKMLISDNASIDRTSSIGKAYAKKDKRIEYYCQKKNIGAVANYEFLLNKADCKYFIWVSDDVWSPNFLQLCIDKLEISDCGMAFTNLTNIDTLDRVIRKYKGYKNFTSSNKLINIFRFLKEPEINGKANIMYSLFRTEICKAAWKACPITYVPYSDVAFVLAALARTNLKVNNKGTLYKRVIRNTDNQKKVDYINIRFPWLHIFPLKVFVPYLKLTLKALRGTRYLWLGLAVMLLRLPQAMINYLIKRLIYVKYLAKMGVKKLLG